MPRSSSGKRCRPRPWCGIWATSRGFLRRSASRMAPPSTFRLWPGSARWAGKRWRVTWASWGICCWSFGCRCSAGEPSANWWPMRSSSMSIPARSARRSRQVCWMPRRRSRGWRWRDWWPSTCWAGSPTGTATIHFFWRTKAGREVDFVVHGSDTFAAPEVKRSRQVHPGDLKAFQSDYPKATVAVLHQGPEPLRIDGILCLPCGDSLQGSRSASPAADQLITMMRVLLEMPLRVIGLAALASRRVMPLFTALVVTSKNSPPSASLT